MSNYPNTQAQRHEAPDFFAAEYFTQEPEDVAQAQRWMSVLGAELAEIDRKLTEMRNPAFRVMKHNGMFASRGEVQSIRETLIDAKNRVLARNRDLKLWRNERVKLAQSGAIHDPNVKPHNHPSIIDAKAMRVAVARYALLDDFFDRFGEWQNLDGGHGAPDDEVEQAWDTALQAFERIEDFDAEREERKPEGAS